MFRSILTAGLAAAALPLAAQPNPFKQPKGGPSALEISYTLAGDQTGTAMLALDGARSVSRQTGTMKLFGKTSNTDTWTLTTPDSVYYADLAKKQGTVAPNLLPALAKAYDGLDGAGKKRFHQNMQDMGAMLSRAFNLSSLSGGEKLSTTRYAGQACEERKWGPVTVCTMPKAPVMLHSKLSLACFGFEQTATEVKVAAPASGVFAPPPGISWKQDSRLQKPDSMAQGFVLYLASQQLADSLAKAKQQLAGAQAQGGQGGQPAQPAQMTPEQEAEMRKGCEAFKNFDFGKALADATNQMAKEIAESAKRAAVDAAKSKIGGLLKKPKIP